LQKNLQNGQGRQLADDERMAQLRLRSSAVRSRSSVI
jgi:hypothetical protein